MSDQAASRPKAIVFDLLTALLDSWTVWDSSTPSQTSAEGLLWRKRYLELTFGCGAYQPYESLVQQSAADVGLPASTCASLVRNWDQIKPWPEVPATLRRLRQEGYLLGVVTNCSMELGRKAIQVAEQSVAGGDFRFDATITAEESGFYKPVKEAYHGILPRLGVRTEEVLFVAGSSGDVQGASDAGMRVVWNNHIGLARKGTALPLREARSLDEALEGHL